MNLEEAVQGIWRTGHFNFERIEGTEYHTDSWWDISMIYDLSNPIYQSIREKLVYILLEANPDWIVESDYDGMSWGWEMIDDLMKMLGHDVFIMTLVDHSSLQRGLLPPGKGNAVLLEPVVTFGYRPKRLLEMAIKRGLTPKSLLTILDRSPTNTFEWEGMSVGAAFRKKTNIWPSYDCPLCARREHLTIVGMVVG